MAASNLPFLDCHRNISPVVEDVNSKNGTIFFVFRCKCSLVDTNLYESVFSTTLARIPLDRNYQRVQTTALDVLNLVLTDVAPRFYWWEAEFPEVPTTPKNFGHCLSHVIRATLCHSNNINLCRWTFDLRRKRALNRKLLQNEARYMIGYVHKPSRI